MPTFRMEVGLSAHGRICEQQRRRPDRLLRSAQPAVPLQQRVGWGDWGPLDRGALCCFYPDWTTDKARYAAVSASQPEQRRNLHDRPFDVSRYEEHRADARAFFEKHGYRALTESQQNIFRLIGIVKPRPQ